MSTNKFSKIYFPFFGLLAKPYEVNISFDKIQIKENIVVDFIGRFEKLQEDFDYVCEQIGVKSIKLPHVKKTEHKHYTEYYNDEMVKIVEDVYISDITRFDYKFGE